MKIFHARAETLGQDIQHRERYDLGLARAVAPLNVLAEYLLPLIKPGGFMLAQKGANPAAELAAAQKAILRLGGQYRQTLALQLPTLDAERHLVLIDKMQPTPDQYPRRPGLPAKKTVDLNLKQFPHIGCKLRYLSHAMDLV